MSQRPHISMRRMTRLKTVFGSAGRYLQHIANSWRLILRNLE